MLDYNQLAALAAVIEEEGFERAGQKLHISQSAVTQRIRQLEEQSGQVLLIRSQPPTLTPRGRELLTHFRKVRILENELDFPEADRDAEEGIPKEKTVIPLAVNADSLATWFTQVLIRHFNIGSAYLDIRSADQDVTHTLLASGEVMGCISASAEPVRGCRVRPLGAMAYRLVCTAEYARRFFPDGPDRASFDAAPKLNFNRDDRLMDTWARRIMGEGYSVDQCYYVPSSDLFPILVREGSVCGMLPDEQYREYKDQWDLVDLAPEHPVNIPLFWQRWSLESEELDRLEALVLEEAAAGLTPHIGRS